MRSGGARNRPTMYIYLEMQLRKIVTTVREKLKEKGVSKMGQHKFNPTVQLAAEGKLDPKPAKIGKKEMMRRLQAEAYRLLLAKKEKVND